jgi:diguanylate cyclase (GGDEF)-like protein
MIQKLHDIYRHARPKLPIAALFGCISYPLYYPVWTWLFPQQYENLWLRLFCSLLCLPFLVTRKLCRFFLWYFYAALIVLLPWFFSFMLLKNNWSPTWVMSSLGATFLLFLIVYDGLIACLMIAIGFSAACLSLQLTGNLNLLAGFEWSYLPVFIFMLVSGYILSANRIAQEKILKYQAGFDCLTGLHNRHHMEDSLRREVARANRSGAPLGVMMLDLDHFKQINDRYGHLIGDCILKGMGEQLVQLIRDEDIACRYGGEEFLLILPGADGNQLQQRAEQIREQLAEMLITLLEYPKNQQAITVSIGLGILQTGMNLHELISNADTALYRAKQGGRNRVECGWISQDDEDCQRTQGAVIEEYFCA